MEISTKYQWKSIGNPVEISINTIGNYNEFNRIVNEIPMEISMTYQWKYIGHPFKLSMKYQ